MSLNTTFILSSLSFFVLNNYMLCYLITTLTIDAMSVGDRIYELNWFQLSRREQFIVYIIIRRSQDAFELKGLGVFVCSLETYAKVIWSISQRRYANLIWFVLFCRIPFFSWFKKPCHFTWYSGNCISEQVIEWACHHRTIFFCFCGG